MIHVGDRGIYSSICADAARRFAGEKCGQNMIKKWSLGKRAVPTNDIFFKSMVFSLHHGNEVGKKGAPSFGHPGKKGDSVEKYIPLYSCGLKIV